MNKDTVEKLKRCMLEIRHCQLDIQYDMDSETNKDRIRFLTESHELLNASFINIENSIKASGS